MPKLFLALLLTGMLNIAVAAPLPVEQAAPGLYVHHGLHEELDVGYHGDICNIGFIIGSRGVAVIDSGGSLAVGQRLRETIRQVTDLPVLYVINTHVHPDHIFGNAAFLADNPAYVGHHKLAEAMERRREIYLRNNAAWLGADATGSELIKPTQSVESTMEIDLGNRKLLLTAYPVSHTNTDLTVLDITTASLWSGDLLFVERTPSIDGDIKGWLQTIAKLRQVPAQRIVPGHGAVAADWVHALDDEQHYLETLLNDVRASIKKGEVMEQSMDTAAASEKGKWMLFESVNRRNVNIIYPALEWE
jgi:quinoprotein relay system zinc metallohydrolase 2